MKDEQRATLAQQQSMQGVLKAVARQRDAAHGREMELGAQLEVLSAQLAEAQGAVASLKAELEKLQELNKKDPVELAAKEAVGTPKVVKSNGKGAGDKASA